MGFSRHEYWSGLSFPSPEYLPNQGSNPCPLYLLHWQADSLPLSHLQLWTVFTKFSFFVDFLISSVQLLSRVQIFVTPWITACQASLSITVSWSSLTFTSIESVMPSSHLILCRLLLLLPSIPPSIRVFSNESTLGMRCPKYWSFSFSIIPSKEIPGLISFRMDWLDLRAVQGTLKSLLQHHTSPQGNGFLQELTANFYLPNQRCFKNIE